MTWFIKWGATMKGWLIAIGGVLVAIGTAFLVGRREQSVDDKADDKVAQAKANAVVTETLNNISETAKEVDANVQTAPPNGPGSAADQLHNNWNSDAPNDGP